MFLSFQVTQNAKYAFVEIHHILEKSGREIAG